MFMLTFKVETSTANNYCHSRGTVLPSLYLSIYLISKYLSMNNTASHPSHCTLTQAAVTVLWDIFRAEELTKKITLDTLDSKCFVAKCGQVPAESD